MKKYIALLIITSVLIFIACNPESPTQVTDKSINTNTLVLSKLVTVGNSLTAGIQSSGLAEDFQMHSYPYLIAQQLGQGADRSECFHFYFKIRDKPLKAIPGF